MKQDKLRVRMLDRCSISYGEKKIEDMSKRSSNISAIEKLLMNDDLLSVNYREHLLTDILFMIYYLITN